MFIPTQKKATLKNWWLFGGGTALSIFHFNHRKSFDIDILITQSQVFDFFNPKWFIDDTKIFDGFNNHLMLKTKDNLARDIFDLAVALVKDKHILQNIINSRLTY